MKWNTSTDILWDSPTLGEGFEFLQLLDASTHSLYQEPIVDIKNDLVPIEPVRSEALLRSVCEKELLFELNPKGKMGGFEQAARDLHLVDTNTNKDVTLTTKGPAYAELILANNFNSVLNKIPLRTILINEDYSYTPSSDIIGFSLQRYPISTNKITILKTATNELQYFLLNQKRIFTTSLSAYNSTNFPITPTGTRNSSLDYYFFVGRAGTYFKAPIFMIKNNAYPSNFKVTHCPPNPGDYDIVKQNIFATGSTASGGVGFIYRSGDPKATDLDKFLTSETSSSTTPQIFGTFSRDGRYCIAISKTTHGIYQFRWVAEAQLWEIYLVPSLMGSAVIALNYYDLVPFGCISGDYYVVNKGRTFISRSTGGVIGSFTPPGNETSEILFYEDGTTQGTKSGFFACNLDNYPLYYRTYSISGSTITSSAQYPGSSSTQGNQLFINANQTCGFAAELTNTGNGRGILYYFNYANGISEVINRTQKPKFFDELDKNDMWDRQYFVFTQGSQVVVLSQFYAFALNYSTKIVKFCKIDKPFIRETGRNNFIKLHYFFSNEVELFNDSYMLMLTQELFKRWTLFIDFQNEKAYKIDGESFVSQQQNYIFTTDGKRTFRYYMTNTGPQKQLVYFEDSLLPMIQGVALNQDFYKLINLELNYNNQIIPDSYLSESETYYAGYSTPPIIRNQRFIDRQSIADLNFVSGTRHASVTLPGRSYCTANGKTIEYKFYNNTYFDAVSSTNQPPEQKGYYYAFTTDGLYYTDFDDKVATRYAQVWSSPTTGMTPMRIYPITEPNVYIIGSILDNTYGNSSFFIDLKARAVRRTNAKGIHLMINQDGTMQNLIVFASTFVGRYNADHLPSSYPLNPDYALVWQNEDAFIPWHPGYIGFATTVSSTHELRLTVLDEDGFPTLANLQTFTKKVEAIGFPHNNVMVYSTEYSGSRRGVFYGAKVCSTLATRTLGNYYVASGTEPAYVVLEPIVRSFLISNGWDFVLINTGIHIINFQALKTNPTTGNYTATVKTLFSGTVADLTNKYMQFFTWNGQWIILIITSGGNFVLEAPAYTTDPAAWTSYSVETINTNGGPTFSSSTSPDLLADTALDFIFLGNDKSIVMKTDFTKNPCFFMYDFVQRKMIMQEGKFMMVKLNATGGLMYTEQTSLNQCADVYTWYYAGSTIYYSLADRMHFIGPPIKRSI